MTITPITGVSFVQAATMLATHLADHDLLEPVSLSVTASWGRSAVTAQLRCATASMVAGDLLAWASTLHVVTVAAWRPPEGDRVHLSLASTLTGPEGAVELDVFGGAEDDPVLFVDLAPGQRREASLAELCRWAAGDSRPGDGIALPAVPGASS